MANGRKTKDKPSVAGAVVVGVLVTGVILGLFLAFGAAAAGNAGATSVFMNRELPISVCAFIVYVIACIGLIGAKRDGAALLVSLAPAFLVFVGYPALQAAALLIQNLLR